MDHGRLIARVPRAQQAELLMAEAWESGALGIEEVDAGEALELIIYAPTGALAGLHAALRSLGLSDVHFEIEETLPVVDWAEAWKEGLEPIVIGDRLVVRPSFTEPVSRPGQAELIIDPGQAFGTGGHASTLLILRWLDALANGTAKASRVLDVGTGTGVLALAALRLGSRQAFGFDLDHVAVREAAHWAAYNGLAERLCLFTGPIEALAGPGFDRVLVNMLRAETLPIAEAIAGRVAPGGDLLLSGLMEPDRTPMLDAFAPLGLELEGELSTPDPSGGHWIALRLVRTG